MTGLRTAALGAACSILAATSACSTKPAGDTAAANGIDTGSVSAGASAASVDSAARADSSAAVAPPAAATPTNATTASAPAAAASASTSGTAAGTTPAATAPNVARASATVPAGAKPSTATAPGTKTSSSSMTRAATNPKPPTATAARTGATAAATGATASAAATTSSSSASASAASAQGGSVRVNKFMTYDAAAKTVTLDVIAAYNSVQGGFNFNGGSNGSQTITVPAGWQVTMHVKNVDAIPHSAIVILDQRPLPNAPDTPAIPRAYSAHVNDGLPAQTGADDLNFRASKPGKYLIYCGVPGHGPSGMFINFVVSESATKPTYEM